MIILVLGSLSWFVLYAFTYFFLPSVAIMKIAYQCCISIPLVLLATTVIGNRYYNKINALVYTITVLWIPLLLYLFMGAFILSILSLFLPMALLSLSSIVLGLLILICFIWGIAIACKPKIVEYTLDIPKLKQQWGNKKIVLVSDVHLGMVRSTAFMKKIVSMINDQNPDIVFIAGDLIDGPVFPYEQGLAPLSEIKSTFGTFYTAGNHDEYNKDQKKYYEVLKQYVTVLNDEKVMINETQIVGVIFAVEKKKKTQERLLATGFDKNLPSIVMLHDPRNASALAEEGVLLGLSGHTHAGQFFPTTLLVRGSYRALTKGIHYINGMAHITSVGVGTSGPLFRLGTKPEVAVIKIQ